MASEVEKGYQQDSPPMYTTGASLPNYIQAIHDPTEVPPPSYESLFGKVQAAKQSSTGFADFMKKFIILFLGTIGCTVFIGLLMAIPIAMIAIGAIHLHDCPAEHYIPIYLIVAGTFGTLKNLISIFQRCFCDDKDDNNREETVKANALDVLLNCFLIAWFIAGNVWVYRVWGHFNESDPTAANYCHPLLYYFAFWVTTTVYILVIILCCCLCLGGVVATVVTAK